MSRKNDWDKIRRHKKADSSDDAYEPILKTPLTVKCRHEQKKMDKRLLRSALHKALKYRRDKK